MSLADPVTEQTPILSFALAAGSFHVVTGAPGSGKTRLLRLAGLRTWPARGAIWLAGRDTGGLDRRAVVGARRRIGFMAAGDPAFLHLDVFDNAAAPRRIAGESRTSYSEPVMELLRWVGLARSPDAPAGRLAMAQRRRLSLAMALACGPDLLLADEPTAGLADADAKAVLRLLAQAHAAGTTVLMATGDEKLATSSGAPIMRLRGGGLEF
ncbi:MAG: ATP-binding cassette domain-containing protein, partial [Caulobacteraceae bacterium]